LFQNNYQQDDTFGLSFISGLVVLRSTCFELQGAHHQEFHFFTVQAVSGILCNLLLYSIRSHTCSVPDCTCFELQGAHHQEFHFFTVQAASGILCNLLLYSTRSPTCSVPDCTCFELQGAHHQEFHFFTVQAERRTTNPEIKDSPKVSSCW